MNLVFNKNNLTLNILVVTLIILSGNPFVNHIGFEVAHLAFLIPLLAYSVYKGYFNKISQELNFFLFFGFIFIFQAVYFSSFTLLTYAGFFTRALICLCVIICVNDFYTRFVKVMYFLTKMGVGFWLLSFTGIFSVLTGFVEPLHQNEWTGEAAYSFLFHTLYVDEYGETLRNAGFFWEPGAFSAYIILALILLIVNERFFLKKEYKTYFVVFSIGVLTSMSTMGYIALLMIFSIQAAIYFYRERTKIKKLSISMVAILIGFLSIVYFSNLYFVGEKISDQLQKAAETSYLEYGENNTRFGSLLFDFYYIQKSPVFGNGMHESTRYSEHALDTIASGHGNGLTDFVAKFGLLGFLFFIYCWVAFSRSSNLGPMLSIGLLLVLLTTLFSEPLFNYPLYWFMFFKSRPS